MHSWHCSKPTQHTYHNTVTADNIHTCLSILKLAVYSQKSKLACSCRHCSVFLTKIRVLHWALISAVCAFLMTLVNNSYKLLIFEHFVMVYCPFNMINCWLEERRSSPNSCYLGFFFGTISFANSTLCCGRTFAPSSIFHSL